LSQVRDAVRQSDRAEADNAKHVIVPWLPFSAPPGPVITRAEGVYFWDDTGRKYLDFGSQLAFSNLGHGERRVIDAIKEQADDLAHIAPMFTTPARSEAARRLNEITPGDLSLTFFSTSGAEANEAAFKIAKNVTGRPLVCARTPSYHGSTYGAMSLSHNPWALAFAPGVPGVFHVPVCNPYRCKHAPPGGSCVDCGEHCAREVEQAILLHGPDRVAALILEPVVGSSAGVAIPGTGYLETLREICTRYGILLIADEVMSGFGRTGRWFACDHWGVVPDIMTMAKGLTGGYIPMGATVIRESFAEHWTERNFLHGHTYSGHALGCAAIVASVDVYETDRLVERAAESGNYLLARLQELKEKHPSVGDARGIGLFTAIELVKDRATKEPLGPEVRSEVVRQVWDQDIYLFAQSFSPNTIMLTPPLTVTTDHIEEVTGALDVALSSADAQVG
jgi:taurine---2-oxoglutarate transaminase